MAKIDVTIHAELLLGASYKNNCKTLKLRINSVNFWVCFLLELVHLAASISKDLKSKSKSEAKHALKLQQSEMWNTFVY